MSLTPGTLRDLPETTAMAEFRSMGSPATAAMAGVTETTGTVIAGLRTGAEEDWLDFSLPEAVRVMMDLGCQWCSYCILSSILR